MRNLSCFFLYALLAPSLIFGQLQELVQLSDEVSESSGLAFDGKTLWTHNDSGNQAALYAMDSNTGQVLKKMYPPTIHNEDWEDLALGNNGIIYISDTGNNNFSRKSLKIHGVIPNSKEAKTVLTTTIVFTEDYTTKKARSNTM